MTNKKCLLPSHIWVSVVFLIMTLSLVFPAEAQRLDISRYDDKSGKDVTEAILISTPGKFSLFSSVNSAGHGEVLVGKTFNIFDLQITPYLGAERLKEGRLRTRGIVFTSWSHGHWFASFVAGDLGSDAGLNKQQLSYITQSVALSVVNHSAAGPGFRVDWKISDKITPYVTSYKNRKTVGLAAYF